MLMDLFLKTLPCITQPHTTPPNPTTDTAHPSSSSRNGGGGIQAQRLHFHAFMLGVHQQLHALQQVRRHMGQCVMTCVMYWWDSPQYVCVCGASQRTALALCGLLAMLIVPAPLSHGVTSGL